MPQSSIPRISKSPWYSTLEGRCKCALSASWGHRIHAPRGRFTSTHLEAEACCGIGWDRSGVATSSGCVTSRFRDWASASLGDVWKFWYNPSVAEIIELRQPFVSTFPEPSSNVLR